MTYWRALFLIILIGCTIRENIVVEPVYEDFQSPLVYFCTRDNCNQILKDLFLHANQIDCAFYSFNNKELKDSLKEKSRIVIEYENKADVQELTSVRTDGNMNLMHNKFCILGNTVITGSYNPATKSTAANNLIIITSPHLAQNYRDEFEELWHSSFSKGKHVKHPAIRSSTTLIENYFCPEDACKKHVLETLKKAKKNIYFMTYSFTDRDIADLLLRKNRTIAVKGVFDTSQLNQWSQYPRLQTMSTAQKGVHHKFFIIDEKIVITGSANPTTNGYERNDENILIIQDTTLAQRFLEEFNSLTT